ncbi:PadR family transcriptional regulator [Microcella alkalica]|uniref:DNA-binding PadR family transcriptional regulator n=1 Tax=Microcella alkalica TaxID=355930 RepID=A0A839EFD4_9MICO|nr:PadR family transcriptional regulator [Microcella alkalica]MBA8848025.1 DNA-binding PadR family transcriptional regulator [Microcella alkalica]
MRSSSSAGFDIREAVDGIRDAFAPRSGARSSTSTRGDIRVAVLSALSREPMNGHQVMQTIAASSGGAWMPGASEVYPMLQQLTDEGLLHTQNDGERTVYSLTETGRAAAAETLAAAAASAADRDDADPADHDRREHWRGPRWDESTAAVPRAGAKLVQAAAQVAQSGSREQKERAAALLDETRRKLYALLAEG